MAFELPLIWPLVLIVLFVLYGRVSNNVWPWTRLGSIHYIFQCCLCCGRHRVGGVIDISSVVCDSMSYVCIACYHERVILAFSPLFSHTTWRPLRLRELARTC